VIGVKQPPETAAMAFVPNKTNFLFQAASPLGTRAIIRELERVSKFLPRGAIGLLFQVALEGGFEFEIGHRGVGFAGAGAGFVGCAASGGLTFSGSSASFTRG
jgi:hypothetical protein